MRRFLGLLALLLATPAWSQTVPAATTLVPADSTVTEAKFNLSDVTTADADATKHGLMPKGTGNATDCYLGDGTVAVCPGGSGTDISVRVYNNVNQNVLASTPTAITFNSEEFDTTGMHDTVVNTSRITIATTGIYTVGCNLSYEGADFTGSRQVIITKNGTAIIDETIAYPTQSGSTIMEATSVINLAATDYIECVAYQGSASTLAAQKQNGGSGVIYHSPVFWAVKQPG